MYILPLKVKPTDEQHQQNWLQSSILVLTVWNPLWQQYTPYNLVADEGSPEITTPPLTLPNPVTWCYDFCCNRSQQHQQQQQQPDLLESAYLTFLAASQRKKHNLGLIDPFFPPIPHVKSFHNHYSNNAQHFILSQILCNKALYLVQIYWIVKFPWGQKALKYVIWYYCLLRFYPASHWWLWWQSHGLMSPDF